MEDVMAAIRYALNPSVGNEMRSEKLYWLYRTAKENPEQFQIAFLLESNRLQHESIDKLRDAYGLS